MLKKIYASSVIFMLLVSGATASGDDELMQKLEDLSDRQCDALLDSTERQDKVYDTIIKANENLCMIVNQLADTIGTEQAEMVGDACDIAIDKVHDDRARAQKVGAKLRKAGGC